MEPFPNTVITKKTDTGDLLLSVVVPAYNEEQGLSAFHKRLCAILNSMAIVTEVIYVNDGSTDRTLEEMRLLKESDPRIAIVDMSRNFGKEIAMTAGLDHANGDVIVVIDADLQDPPELIPQLFEQWKNGYDMVYAKRSARDGESAIKKVTAHVFYRLIQKMSRVSIPEDVGDFRLFSRRAGDALKQLREQHRFMKGLFAWIGFSQKAVFYRRAPRYGGKTKWNYWGLWNFALEGITSFTIAPLKIATYLGLFIALASFIYAGFIIFRTLVVGNPVAGYPSVMVTILFLGAVQLIAIGIIGEYLGRMFDEIKQRPLYVLRSYEPSKSSSRKFEALSSIEAVQRSSGR